MGQIAANCDVFDPRSNPPERGILGNSSLILEVWCGLAIKS